MWRRQEAGGLSYEVAAAGQPRQQPGQEEAERKGEDGQGEDGEGRGQPSAQQGVDAAQHEYVHQIDAIAQPRHAGYDGPRAAAAGKGLDEDEGPEALEDDVGGAEAPAQLELLEGGGGGDAAIPYGGGDGIADEVAHCAGGYHAAARPAQVVAQVVGKDKVAQEAGEVEEGVELVPVALAVYVAAGGAQVGEECRQDPQQQEGGLAAAPCARQPGRDDGHEQVEPHEHVDKPHVAAGVVEVGGQADYGAEDPMAVVGAPGTGEHGIEHRPDGKGDHYPDEPLLQEEGRAAPQGHKQVGGDHDKQGHGAAQGAVDNADPPAVGHRPDADFGAVDKEKLARMDHDHHEAGYHAHVVEKHDSIFHRK